MIKFLKSIWEFIQSLFKMDDDVEPVEPSITDIDDYDEPSGATEEPITIINEDDNMESGETITESGFVSTMKILIDNGHGNNTAGKRSPWSAHKVAPEIDFYEYKWNREIAKPIVEGLRERGYDAELLVTEETDISLTERANRANKFCDELGAKNVLIVSIHANAAGHGDKWMNAKGWCAYTTKGNTKSDTLAEFLYNEAEKNFKDRQIRKDMSDGDRDWEANFTVIYKPKCVAVLTENFFYDNVDDVQYILSNKGREAVIKTHVDGIIKYIKSLEK